MTDLNLPISDDPTPPPEGSRFGKAHHVLLIFTGLVLVIWLLSGIYQVNTDEVAIVERLGTYLSNTQGKALLVDHGLHYALPWPIDRVHKISIQQRRTLAVKTFNVPSEGNADLVRDLRKRGYPQDVISSLFDPYLITGDKNVVHAELAVQYIVDDPEAWLNTVSHSSLDPDKSAGDRETLFLEIAQHALTSRIAALDVDNVLFSGQANLTTSLHESIQKELTLPNPADPAGESRIPMGIRIQTVELIKARPPDRVKDRFDDVGAARADKATAITQAGARAAAAITQANARKTTLIYDAQAYREQVVNAAKGEAQRFQQVLAQYEVSPDVTRWSIYVDAVKSVSSDATRIFFAQPGQHLYITIDPPKFDANTVAPK